MSWKQFFVWILLFGVVQVGVQWAVPIALPPRFEYQTHYLSTRSDGEFYGGDLKKLGEEGWQLVEIVPLDSQTHICYLKRPVFRKASKSDDRR